mgnify:CR=1 FL=1
MAAIENKPKINSQTEKIEKSGEFCGVMLPDLNELESERAFTNANNVEITSRLKDDK